MAHDVFISYSSGDKPTADAIANALETRGIWCWIAPRDVLPGEEWGPAIVRAIEHARIMVLVFSSHANASRQVSREVQLAFENNQTVIPFRVEDVLPTQALKYYLSPVHWLDALTPPLAQHIRLLADRIQSYLDAVSGGHPPSVGDPSPSPSPGPVASTIATAPATEPSQPEAYKEPADAEEAVRRGLKSASAYWSRGNAYREKGKPDQAVADYTDAIRLDPKFANAYCDRGIVYAERGEPDKAIADYTEAIRLEPRHALAYYDRGVAYVAMGEPDKAIADYTDAIRLNPKFAISYAGRANRHFINGEAEKASRDIEEAIPPRSEQGLRLRGPRANLRETWAARSGRRRPQEGGRNLAEEELRRAQAVGWAHTRDLRFRRAA